MITVPAINGAPEYTPEGAIYSECDGATYTFYFEGDEFTIPEPEAIAPRNWATFRLGMLSNPAFRRITDKANCHQIDGAAIASEINQNPPNEPSVSALTLIWNNIITNLPQGVEPTTLEVSGWQAIADAANVPLLFQSDGTLPNG
jgi:hypothetical protein